MKLKIYHGVLLSLLFITLSFSIFMGVYSSIKIFSAPVENPVDTIIYLVCYLLLFAFIITEIVNTFISFKTGSMFVQKLTFDDDAQINRPLIGICVGILAIAIAVFIFSLIIYVTPNGIFLSTSSPLVKGLLCSISLLIITNTIALILFPCLGRNDKSFKKR